MQLSLNQLSGIAEFLSLTAPGVRLEQEGTSVLGLTILRVA